MRAVFETGFCYLYLIFIIGLGVYLFVKKKNMLMGVACVSLGFGDAFHLIPRAVGLYTNTLDNPSTTLAAWLGFGKLMTSAMMTVFYVCLYLFIYRKTKTERKRYFDITVAALFLIRIALLIPPQNEWLSNGNSILWGTLRNIPFILLGGLVIFLLFKHFRKEKYFRFAWLAIVLSFAFYIPVVFLAAQYNWVGLLMLPKTCCYVWFGVMVLLNTIKATEPVDEKAPIYLKVGKDKKNG